MEPHHFFLLFYGIGAYKKYQNVEPLPVGYDAPPSNDHLFSGISIPVQYARRCNGAALNPKGTRCLASHCDVKELEALGA